MEIKLELGCMLACMIVIKCAVNAASRPLLMPRPLDDRERSLAACLLHISQYYSRRLKHHIPVTVLKENDKLTNSVNVFLSSLQVPWFIQSQPWHFNVQSQAIFIIFSSSTIIFESYKEITFTSRYSRYIFVIDYYVNVTDLNLTLTRMMRMFWRLKMYRSVVLVLHNNKIEVYSMKPFNESNCGVVSEAVLINSWSFSSQSFDKSPRVFSLKRIVSNFYGCPLNAVMETRPPESMIVVDGNNVAFLGPGAQILDILQKAFNFTTNVTFVTRLSQLDRFGYVIFPGKSNLIKELIESEKVDFGFGIFSHGIYHFPTLHLASAAYSECFTWAAACGIRSEPSLWDNYVNEFSSFTWVMIAAVFIVVFLLKSCFEYTMKPKINRNVYLTILFGMYKNSIGQPEAKNNPRNRLFKIIWLQYCFIILSLYLSSLGSFMTLPLTGKNVETLEQILQMDLNVIGTDATFKIFNATATTHEDINAKVAKRFKLIRNGSYDELIKILVYGEKSILFASKRIQMHYSQYRSNEMKDKRPICPFDKCTVIYNASPLLLRQDSFLKRIFHEVTQKVFESGILTKLWNIYEPRPINKVIPYHRNVFEIGKLHGAFVAYFFGISVSFLTFCCEYIVKYLICPFLRRRRLLKLKNRLQMRFVQHSPS